MTVLRDLDRLYLVQDLISCDNDLGNKWVHLNRFMQDKLVEHEQYIEKYSLDMPEILNWKWNDPI